MGILKDLVTENLLIRGFRETDGEDLYEYLSDEDGNLIWKDTYEYVLLKDECTYQENIEVN